MRKQRTIHPSRVFITTFDQYRFRRVHILHIYIVYTLRTQYERRKKKLDCKFLTNKCYVLQSKDLLTHAQNYETITHESDLNQQAIN